MSLIESQKVHEMLADFYDVAYKKNPVFAKRTLSSVIRILKAEVCNLEAEAQLSDNSRSKKDGLDCDIHSGENLKYK